MNKKAEENSGLIKGDHAIQKQNGSCYSVASGKNQILMDASAGGRIISFKHNGFDFLTGISIHKDNYGSTFWPSPQSIWNWPPPRVLDSNPYEAEENSGRICLRSGSDPVTGLVFTKEITACEGGVIGITYKIHNTSDKPAAAAPWEITRVIKGGLLFFPVGDDSMRGKQFGMADYNIISEIVWYKDDLKRPDEHKLNIADGLEGWMAYAAGKKVFVKIFDDVKPEMQAPNEAEILFYLSPEADYIEIEVQGKYELIPPAGSTVWEMKWTAAEIPAGIAIVPGSTRLVEFVRSLIRA